MGMRFEDGSHADIKVPTSTYVGEAEDQWRRNPIPGCNCDVGEGCGGKFLEGTGGCTGIDSTPYAIHGSPTSACPRGTMFEAHFDEFTQGYLVGAANKFSVMDEVNVPNKPGEYVLSWRWDCEETDQVWSSCADIVITDGSHADIKVPTSTYVGEAEDQWRRNPIPGCNCDVGEGCGGKFLEGTGGCTGIDSTPYAIHGSPTSACPRGTMFEAHFDEFTQGF